MRNMKSYLFFLLMAFLILSGCDSNDQNINRDIFQYKDSFVGDNSAVGNITNQLPGAEHLKNFELKTKEEPYGIILNYDWTESEQQYKESVINNATILFTLIQNVDWITFNSDILEFTIRKETIQEWYGEKLSEVQNEEELTEMIQKHLENENKVRELFN